MLLGNPVADLIGGLLNEVDALSHAVLGVLLIAAGVGCILASRKDVPRKP